jgi:hypothetical protein
VAPPKKSGGCWKWGAIGCLAVLVIAAIGAGAIVMIVFGAIKSSDVYRGALATAQRDPRVIEALGSPIKGGWWVTGNVGIHGGSGDANIEFSIEGPKGNARVHAVATRQISAWRYSELTVTPVAPANSPPIDLLSR